MKQAPHFPKSQELAEQIAELTDEDLFKVSFGTAFLAEDPVNHAIRVVDSAGASAEDRKQKLDVQKNLADFIVKERPEMVGRVADAFRMALQTAPDFLETARNEVRRNFGMTPVEEAALARRLEPMVGRVTQQNETQSIFTDLRGAKSYLLEHSDLVGGKAPRRDASLRLERSKTAEGKFLLSPLTRTLTPPSGPTQ